LIFKHHIFPIKILQEFLCVNRHILFNPAAEVAPRTSLETATAPGGLWGVPGRTPWVVSNRDRPLVYIHGKEMHLAMNPMPSCPSAAPGSLRPLLNVSCEHGVWLPWARRVCQAQAVLSSVLTTSIPALQQLPGFKSQGQCGCLPIREAARGEGPSHPGAGLLLRFLAVSLCLVV